LSCGDWNTKEYVDRDMKLLRARLGQPPAFALKGLDALNLFAVDHPDAAKLLGFDCAVSSQIV
jgi:hypothetical protein